MRSAVYLKIDQVPPRIFVFGAGPLIALFLFALIAGRNGFISRLDIRSLTLLHAVRIPVEIVLFALYKNKLVPEAMTFDGFNFDILSGLSALVIWYFGFRNGTNRPVLIAWNLAALVLLAIIVTTAIRAFPSPLQSIAFDQPNIAVAYFPFAWLPSIVVPIVLFAHLAALWKLLFQPSSRLKSATESEP